MAISTTTILTDTSGTVYADADALYDAFNTALGSHVAAATTMIAEAVSASKCSITTTLSADGSGIQVEREWSDDSAFTNFRASMDLDAINLQASDAGWTIQYIES